MSQPPLSRALRALEADLGVVLLHHTPQGVTLTAAGEALHAKARALLEQAERLRARVAAAAGVATLTVGTLPDTVEHVGGRLVAAFRERYPHVQVTTVEADLGDPTGRAPGRSGRRRAHPDPVRRHRHHDRGRVHEGRGRRRAHGRPAGAAGVGGGGRGGRPAMGPAPCRHRSGLDRVLDGSVRRRAPGAPDHPGVPAVRAVERDVGTGAVGPGRPGRARGRRRHRPAAEQPGGRVARGRVRTRRPGRSR